VSRFAPTFPPCISPHIAPNREQLSVDIAAANTSFHYCSAEAKASAASASGGGEPKPKKRKMTKGVTDAKQYESKKDDFYDDL
jgi:hypothetical protein